MEKVDKSMIISDILDIDPALGPVLMACGMHCIGCPSAQGESLEMAAAVHGMNADELTKTLNDYLEKQAQ